MGYCYPNKQVCTIDKTRPKTCIECIYIYHYGAKDTEDLHRKIVEMFDSSKQTVKDKGVE